MAKAKTPSYVVELLIAPVRREEDRQLWASFEAAKRLTNVMLQHGTSLVKAMRCDPAWVTARLLPKATKPQQKARAVAFTSIRSKYGFSEYEFHKVVAQHKNKAGFTDRVGANVAQKIGTRVFKACEKWLTGAGGKPRFKGRKRPQIGRAHV